MLETTADVVAAMGFFIVATMTAGLGIARLADWVSEVKKARFQKRQGRRLFLVPLVEPSPSENRIRLRDRLPILARSGRRSPK